jgi:hypothetical protein
MSITPALAGQEPLLTEADMVRRLEELLAPAIHNGQLWILFLDRRRCQLPLMVPIENLPAAPDPAAADVIVGILADLRAEFDSVILAIERLGTDAVASVDRRWAAALRHGALTGQVRVAGVFLVTPHRVSAVRD